MTPPRLGVIVATSVVVVGDVGTDASCPAEIVWSGAKYVGPVRTCGSRRPGDPLDPASTTACNGSDGVRPVAVTSITGIDPDVAVQTTDGVVHPSGSVEMPAEARELRTAHPCPGAAGEMATEGLPAGYDGGGEVRRPIASSPGSPARGCAATPTATC